MLDQDQLKAVRAPLKNNLVIANAGSGKTRVLTYRVKHLIENGVPEDEIMLLTFTNKAAREMIERVNGLLNGEVDVLAGTFHRIAVILLKKYAKFIGLNNNFNILPTEDAKELMGLSRQAYLAQNPQLNKKDIPDRGVIYALNSGAINKNIPLKEYCMDNNLKYEQAEHIERIVFGYMEKKDLQDSLDFDDLLIAFRDLLNQDYIREQINEKYKHILVDEYQDINWVQAEIIAMLNGNNLLFAVGDSEQSIYKFRGSSSSFIENFENHYPDADIHQIRFNYRSQAGIIKLAENSINNNPLKYKKEMVPFIDETEKPSIVMVEDEAVQGYHIVKTIKRLNYEGVPYSEMAILLRTHSLTRSVEYALNKAKVPYKVIGGLSFFERAHTRDILALLRVVTNPKDEVAFSRLYNLMDGIGSKSIEKAYDHLKNNDYDLSCLNPTGFPFKVNKNAYEGFSILYDLLDKILEKESIQGCLKHFFDNFYYEYLRMKYEDAKDRVRDLETLLAASAEYSDVTDFLNDLIITDEKDPPEDGEAVSILSIHKAKGLEWDVVFIPYLANAILPHNKSIAEDEVDEERRLFYVAMTRARKHLYMYDLKKMMYFVPMFGTSDFILELDESLYIKAK